MRRSPDLATREVGGRRGSPRRAAGLVLVLLLAVSGAGLVGVGLRSEPDAPPQPAPAAAREAPDGPPAPAAPSTRVEAPEETQAPTAAPQVMAPMEPSRITIPEIDVEAELMTLGIDDDGMVEVPPLEQAELAGWYRYGPTPGEAGSSVVVGHVDSYAIGPAVFFELGALQRGDVIEVERTDGSVASFVVDGIESHPKEQFPTDAVYGHTEHAELRVITCGGEFDRAAGSYLDNIIVYATLDPDRSG